MMEVASGKSTTAMVLVDCASSAHRTITPIVKVLATSSAVRFINFLVIVVIPAPLCAKAARALIEEV
jgi:hypothetical protein